jgi:hypothetical protein
MTSSRVWVDPPQGWKYGFPLIYDPDKDGNIMEWMIQCGYPKERMDSYGDHFYSRHWPADEKEPPWET